MPGLCRCGQDIWLFRSRMGTRAGSRRRRRRAAGGDLDGCCARVPDAGGRAAITLAVAVQLDPGGPALPRAGLPLGGLCRAQRGGDGGRHWHSQPGPPSSAGHGEGKARPLARLVGGGERAAVCLRQLGRERSRRRVRGPGRRRGSRHRVEAGYARREVQPGDGQPGAGHRRADVRAGGPPHRREAGPHPQARPSPTRSPASRRPPCAARRAGGDPTMPRSPGCCWTPGHGSRNAPGSTPRTSRSPPEPARSACTARAMRSALSPWPGEAGNWSWHGWTCAARCARLGGRRKPAGRARLLCAGRDLGAMSARRASTPASSPTPMAQAVGNVCRESRRDPNAEKPPRQGRNRILRRAESSITIEPA